MTPILRADRSALEARRATLVQRLEDGDRRISRARVDGADTGPWESFWLQLLDEYVDLSRYLEEPSSDAMDVAA